MNRFLLALTLAILPVFAFAGPADTPLKKALTHLEQAKAALTKPNVKNEDRNENVVSKQLEMALSKIDEIKTNKGSHLPLAEKATKAAQAEIAAGDDDTHRKAALTNVEEAIKQLNKAFDIRH